jgi:hypothetical protein
MTIANHTRGSIPYIDETGEKKWIHSMGHWTGDPNNDCQGMTFVVDEAAFALAKPIASDQYFAKPMLTPDGLLWALEYTDGSRIRNECNVSFYGRKAWYFDLVVTRHDPLVQYLREEGWIPKWTPVRSHVSPTDVRGKHVLGVLPHHLSSLCKTVTEVPLAFTPDDRAAMAAGDLPVERVRACAGKLARYKVERLG